MSFHIIANIKNTLTRKALKIHSEKMEAKRALKRSFILSLLLCAVWFQESFNNIWIQLIIFGLGICSLLNLLYFMKTFLKLFQKKPLYGTEEQRKCLNFSENTVFFKVKKSILKAPVKPAGSKLQVACPASLEKQNNLEAFRHQTLHKKHSGKLDIQRNKTDTTKSFYEQPRQQDFIADEHSLQAYLKAYEKAEDAKNTCFSYQHYLHRYNVKSQAARMLETSVYQLATDYVPSGPNFITNCLNNLQTELLAYIPIDQLTQYIYNLRRWISLTILKPLVREIDELNTIFDRLCLSDLKIGMTGLENLRSLVSQTQFVTKHAQSLPLVINFLEICPNQIYLLERLRSLSHGIFLGSLKCRTDSSIQSRNFPNDTAIIFHCICIYLDTQLLPISQGKGIRGRPFYDSYVIVNSGELPIRKLQAFVKNRAGCALFCTDILRPKFNLITKEKLYNGQYGFNNLFHVLLEFLTFLKKNNNGMLDGISLGRSGINVLWVIGESN